MTVLDAPEEQTRHEAAGALPAVDFDTAPDRYRH